MIKNYKKYIIACGVAMLLAVNLAQAAIVPCVGVKTPGDTRPVCNFCSVAELANNVINFLTNISFAVTVVFIIYGAYYMIFAFSDAKRYSDGKQIIRNAVIGLVIVLSAWVTINTILKFATGSAKWYHIECRAE